MEQRRLDRPPCEDARAAGQWEIRRRSVFSESRPQRLQGEGVDSAAGGPNKLGMSGARGKFLLGRAFIELAQVYFTQYGQIARLIFFFWISWW